jgi:hypothetical protein
MILLFGGQRQNVVKGLAKTGGIERRREHCLVFWNLHISVFSLLTYGGAGVRNRGLTDGP